VYEWRLTVSLTDAKADNTLVSVTTVAGATSAVASTMSRLHFCHLSPDELVARNANGECYHFPKKFSADHNCKSKGVFLLELDDGVEPEAMAEDLSISLHALTDIIITDTMKLNIQNKGKTLTVLMDTGSIHTFIKEVVMPHLGL
jgi:hypothetical protein